MMKSFKNLIKKIACVSMTSLVLTVTSLTPLANVIPFDNNATTAYAAASRLYNQRVSKWKDKEYSDGATLYDSGCGVFSTANAVYSLTGNKMNPQTVANFVYSKGVWGAKGVLDRSSFFTYINNQYGATYGFTIGKQVFGSVSDATLINHLKNGGVAVVHVSNHFIAIDDYRTSDGKYHVIESAVSNKRALSPAGWVTAAKLKNSDTGTKVDWYTLISKRKGNSTLAIKATSYPISITKGSSFNLKGSVTSNNKITSFRGQILQNGTVKQSHTINPNSTSVNISTCAVNTNLRFGSLARGTYTLKYSATDSWGGSVSWKINFTVK